MAELETDCCAPGAQASCCEPERKAECCGEHHGAGCGCAATDTPPAGDAASRRSEAAEFHSCETLDVSPI
jgi:hypothetical protein